MLRRCLPPLVAYAFGFGIVWADPLPCEVKEGSADSCVWLLACIGDDGRWMDGRATGWDAGPLEAASNDGVACTGNWTTSDSFAGGRADVFCDAGMTASVMYFSQDPATGTVSGCGMTNWGEIVEAWSGKNVLEYFRGGDPTEGAVLRCGDYGIPLSYWLNSGRSTTATA